MVNVDQNWRLDCNKKSRHSEAVLVSGRSIDTVSSTPPPLPFQWPGLSLWQVPPYFIISPPFAHPMARLVIVAGPAFPPTFPIHCQMTLLYRLHRRSVTGPIFVCRVCTSLPQDAPTRMQVLLHADLSPDSVTPLAQAAVSVQNPPSGSQTCFPVVGLGRSRCEHVSAVLPFPEQLIGGDSRTHN